MVEGAGWASQSQGSSQAELTQLLLMEGRNSGWSHSLVPSEGAEAESSGTGQCWVGSVPEWGPESRNAAKIPNLKPTL